MPITAKADKVISLARECLGTPYRHQGRSCGVEMDCAGPLVHIFKAMGMKFYDPKAYSGRPYKGRLEQILDKQPHLQRVKNNELLAGDLVVFRIKSAPQHLGIFTGENVIHAYADLGRVTEQPFTPWLPQLKRVYRFVQ